MMSPQRAVRKALFRKKYRCIPGVFIRLTVGVCAVVPSWMFRLVLKIPAVKRLLDRV